MHFICKWDWLLWADASCKDRATPTKEHHLLLSVPWRPGGLPADGPTSSEGQRDKADSLPLPIQPGSRGAVALVSIWHCWPKPNSQILMGRKWLTLPLPHFCPPLTLTRWLRSSWNSNLLSVWMAFHLWWEDWEWRINCSALGIQWHWLCVFSSISGASTVSWQSGKEVRRKLILSQEPTLEEKCTYDILSFLFRIPSCSLIFNSDCPPLRV